MMQDNQPFEHRYDAVIVGARCAGASTALLLARAGAKVLVIDRQAYGSDRNSTHALMRAGVLQLARWGVLPEIMAEGTPPIKQATFQYGVDSIQVDIEPEHGVDFLCAPRRTVIDRVLVDAARDAGANIRHGVSLVDLKHGFAGRVTGAALKDTDGTVIEVAAEVVIGADGPQSTVARRAGAPTYVEGKSSSGYVYGYYAGLPHRGFHWLFENETAAGVIPTNDGHHCVFVSVPGGRFAKIFRKDLLGGFLRTAAANSPLLREQLGKARLVGQLRGFGGCAGYFKQPHGRGWALVGDAGYFKDPLTAHGITDALRDAELLSHAVLQGSPRAFARYQDQRDALSRPVFDVTDAIASFAWDLDQVREYHATLSRAMKAEADHIAGFSVHETLAA